MRSEQKQEEKAYRIRSGINSVSSSINKREIKRMNICWSKSPCEWWNMWEGESRKRAFLPPTMNVVFFFIKENFSLVKNLLKLWFWFRLTCVGWNMFVIVTFVWWRIRLSWSRRNGVRFGCLCFLMQRPENDDQFRSFRRKREKVSNRYWGSLGFVSIP